MLTNVAGASVAGFLLGIFYASVFPLSPTVVTIIFVVSITLLSVAHLTKKYATVLLLAVFCCSGAVLGALRYDAVRPDLHQKLQYLVGAEVTIVGSVRAEPDVREGSTRLVVNVSSIDERSADMHMLVIGPPFVAAQYGDEIKVVGTLREPVSFESGTGRSFNYPMYLAARGITYEVSYAKVQVIAPGGNVLVRAVLAIKSAYMRGLRAVLPEPYAGLAAGITAGDKRSVGSELSETFQKVSLIHILVLSGYNITVVLGMFAGVFSRFSRWPRLLAALSIVSFFIVVAGGAASAVRAGAMALAAVYAKNEGRVFAALRVLIAIAFAMVLWNPLLLVFDPGFQLSVLATLGLILFAEPFTRLLLFIPERFQMREIVAATIATQASVLPLLLYQNGILSLVSLPSNVLALIAVPFAMLFSAIAAVAGIVFGTWAVLLALPAYVLLRYIVTVAEMFSAIPFASIEIPAFSVYVLFAAYAFLGVCAVYLSRHGITKNDRQ